MAVQYGAKPFQEALEFFRGKLSLPTATWTDLWEGMHARAFVVAGAMRDDLLADLRQAVDKAIRHGTTLEEFRRDFDAIVDRHGWGYRGGRNWRTRVLYETNLRTAYQAGRYKQMQAIAHRRPFWQYVHSPFVKEPRPEHLAWDGLILRHDDPWWDTHYPPNGWGCRCSVRTLAERDLKKMGRGGPDPAPAVEWEERTVGIRGPNPRTVKVPKGIDPGWGYNVGKAAWGAPLARQVMEEWAASRDAWEPLIASGWAEAGRPERIPLSAPPVALGQRLDSEQAVVEALRKQLGGERRLYRVGALPIEVHAETLGTHVDPQRAEYLPLLDDLLSNPFEVWVNFERHRGSGLVRLRARLVKGYEIKRGKMILFVANARSGMLEAWTMIPMSRKKAGYLNKQRRGILLHGN